MSFASKWQKSKSKMSDHIDRIDKNPWEDNSVNSVNESQGSENHIPDNSVNSVNENCKSEFLNMVHAGDIALLTDGGEGLYPVPRSDWAYDHWGKVQKLWFGCFREIFREYAKGLWTANQNPQQHR